MFKFDLNSANGNFYKKDILEKIFFSVSENIDLGQNGILNIVLTNSETIKELNKNYRQKDSPTDVLSFHYFEKFSEDLKDFVVGEIIICEEILEQQAEEFGLGKEKEFYKLIIHSILHILGFDHETEEDFTEMNKYEKLIWKELFGEEFNGFEV